MQSALNWSSSSVSRPPFDSRSSHRVQFYETESFLSQSVSRFVLAGLNHGEAVIVVATDAHVRELENCLRNENIDLNSVLSTKQLLLLDARELLPKIMKEGLPDPVEFRRTVGEVLRDCASRFPLVRAYGEMVHLLCVEGNFPAALNLEKEWNALAKEMPFQLLCGYSITNFNRETHGVFFDSVCKLHSHIVPTELYSTLTDPDSQSREIARLQQRAQSLEMEVADRLRIEKELRRANEDLLRITYVASHDLKEPLREITTFLQLIKDRYADKLDSQGTRFIHHTVNASARMRELIEGILLHARMSLEEQPLKSVDFNSAFEDAVANLSIAIRNSCGQVTRTSLPTIRAQSVHIVQLFQNLIGNALKFHKTTIPKVHVSARQDGNLWIFSVTDNGIGIPEPYLESVFTLFQKLHGNSAFPGSGIGLATCKKIVESLGGKIWAESELGQGSTFQFTIPEAC